MDEFAPQTPHVSGDHNFREDLVAHKLGPKLTTTTTATSQVGGKVEYFRPYEF